MKKSFLKSLVISSIVASIGTITPPASFAQTVTNNIGNYSVLPEGLVVPPNNTADILIIVDNSASMRNSLPTEFSNETALIGGHHPNSRSFEARRVIRNVLANIEGNVNVGVMEFDIAFTRSNGDNNATNGDRVAVSTCGDEAPSTIPFDPDHKPTPVISGCATPDASGNYALDEFNRIIPDSPNDTYHTYFWPNDTGKGRLRVGIQPLDKDHLERINRVLAPEPKMPELRCTRRTNAIYNHSENIGGKVQCRNNIGLHDDFNADDFALADPDTPPTLADEERRYKTSSYFNASNSGSTNNTGNTDLKYAFNKALFKDDDNNDVPDLYENPEGASIVTLGTATYGSLVSAHDYFRGRGGRYTSLLQSGDSLDTPAASSVQIDPTTTANQCTVSSYILLITDGDPFTRLDGKNINSEDQENCDNPLLSDPGIKANYTCESLPISSGSTYKRRAHTRNKTAPYLTALRLGYALDVNDDGTVTVAVDESGEPLKNFNSIETFVFGFAGLNADAEEQLQLMAGAGSLVEDGVDADGNPVFSPREAFISTDADQLEKDLVTVFNEIDSSISSNSGVAITSSPITGGGAIVTSSYSPFKTNDASEETVYWFGQLTSYFIDEFGFLREDGDQDGILDDYNTDRAFSITFDVESETTLAKRITVKATDDSGNVIIGTSNFDPDIHIIEDTSTVSPNSILPIWEAGAVLNSYPQVAEGDGNTDNIFGDLQRPYGSVGSDTLGYRNLFTSVPAGTTGMIIDTSVTTNLDALTKVDFMPSLVTDDNFGLFAVDTREKAEDVIRFIRGEEGITGFRSRTLDGQQYLLGDIVHSTAAIVDRPSEDFGSRLGDASYTEFVDAYQYRRRMVYVGGNDGMLHAFNAGFFDGDNTSFRTSAADIGCTAGSSIIDCDTVRHALGAELWGYVPQNLIPHLQFLSRTDYQSSVHVAFVDGPVQSFDAQIFDASDTHINGWGTIIVANLRLGGGDFLVDPNNDGDLSDSLLTQSAYLVLDVTDPSQEPTVLAEITDQDIGFATSVPQIMRDGDDWYLVFGSGPNNIQEFTSEPAAGETIRDPYFYKYRLDQDETVAQRLEKIGFSPNLPGTDTVNQSSFVGDVTSKDWNSDGIDDAVYFGVVGGDTEQPTGGLFRFVNQTDSLNTIEEGDVNALLINEQPISAAPVTTTNSGLNWVLFGSGRYLSSIDLSNETQNSFYGIKEPGGDYPEQSLNNLLDMTDIGIAGDTNVDVNGDGSPDPEGTLTESVSGASTADGLTNTIVNSIDIHGWKIDLDIDPSPSDRITAAPIVIDDQVVFATFSPAEPSDSECEPVFGESFANVANVVFGLPDLIASFDTADEDSSDTPGTIVSRIKISDSAITSISAVNTKDTQTGKVTPDIIVTDQNSGITTENIGAAEINSGRASWTELEIQ